MKNLPWKKIAIGAVALGVIGIVIFNLTGGKSDKPVPSYINPAFGEYISSYSAGVLSSGSSIRIVLSQEVVDSSMIGQPASARIFSLSPAVQGKTVWLDRRTVEFKPDARLASGQIYGVEFSLSKLMSVPADLGIFSFTFQVIPQNFDFAIENVKPYVKTELKRQKIEGVLNTADFAEEKAVEQMLGATQDGKNLKVSWVHGSDGRQHNFVVEDVTRTENASKVSLQVKGNALGVNRTVEDEIEIPSLSDFKLMNTRVVQNPTQYVVLQFSDPIKEKQNLAGLIRIASLQNADFEIHDNEIWVYPKTRQSGTQTIYIESGVRNILDYKMKSTATAEVVFEQLKPEVRFTGKGSILPSTDGLILPFEAVNLKMVDVTVMKIFESNVLQFMQVNRIDGNYEMHRVGKRILKKAITLENTGVTDLGKWNRYTLDLATLISAEPGAIYQVKISFKKSYSSYNCGGEETAPEETSSDDDDESVNYYYEDGYYYEDEDYYYYGDYDWNERDNPCHTSFYRASRNITRNVLASDLGLIAKRGSDGNTMVVVTDLKTAQTMQGVSVELYNFQKQVIGTSTTGGDGKVIIHTKEPPFALVAKSGAQRGYLKLQDGESLSLSQFDVSGDIIQKGLKGFLYGERGVWRPGDSLYLTFVLEDKNKQLPSSHPVVFELQNPQGQITSRLVRSSSQNGFYNFHTATSPDAPTGNWTGRIKVGGTQFSQTIKIETVKPNRLKINLDFGAERFTSSNITGNLNVKWLHGAPARNLKAEFDVLLAKAPTTFSKHPDFTFEDPSREFYSEAQTVFSGYTDAEGNAVVQTTLSSSTVSPGFLNAMFRGKVFEESGNFSIDNFTIPYSPYRHYVGMRTPKGERYSGILYMDTTHRVDLVTVDGDGNPASRTLEMKMFQLDRRWWWDYSQGSVASYINSNYAKLVKTGSVSTGSDGKGNWNFEIKTPDWGRYFIQACDPVSGHCTAKVVYLDEPGWYSRYRGDDSRGGAAMLSFSTDKQSYNIGEKINLTIPGSAQGRAFVSIENGSKVIQTYWVETQQGDTRFSVDVTREMTPNVFVHVSLLQPHSQTTNDLPIRLYGVVPVRVEDPATHLEPVLTMPDVLEPGGEVVIKVAEKSKRKMTYTVAVVDEGLLDLTRFRTPDLWNKFYAREALGVRTWDLYDQVMGAFGARVERLLAIGGDMELKAGDEDARANRFRPVVKFFGPFTLDGGTATHKFVMPQYIGSVKTMVVAGYEGAYGKVDKATPVRKPLMLLATLPRVLGPEETVKLPVTLFTAEKDIRNVKVDVKVSGPLSVTGNASRSVTINSVGDLTVDFDLAVQPQTGTAKVEVTASSGSHKASDIIEIEIRNPNTPVTKVSDMLLEAGKTWNPEITPFGIAGTNTAVLEVSNIPPVNLGSRLRYLMNYPYGCVEQTISTVFPQLFLDQVKVLTENEKAAVQRNITAGIERLKSFVQRDGGFSYWPGMDYADGWGTSYAGHFLVEAELKGYYVPADIIRRWKKHQKDKAQEWRRNDKYVSSDLMQAYRLYTLAMAGSPELGAMNRLREMGSLNPTAAWMLAASYVKAGQPEAAKKMIANLPSTIKPYREMGYCYGSDLRDKALVMETLVLLNEKTKAFELLKEISAQLSNAGYWMSTQEIAFALKGIASFISSDKRDEVKYTYTIGGKAVTATSQLPVSQVNIPVDGVKRQNINLVNDSKGSLFVRLITEGTPAHGQEEDTQNNLNLAIRYTDSKGSPIDPSRLEQGTEFIAVVSVTHPGMYATYENLALAQVFPSGWEINNLRLEGTEQFLKSDAFTYQDIRDDRVYTYFDLYRNTTRTFRVMLTAAYAGSFYLPATSCEAMYDNSRYARKKGQVVEVVKPAIQ